VTRDIKNHNYIQIIGRDVQKTKMIKEVIKKIIISDLKVLRDQLYFIKVNNIYRDDVFSIKKLLLLEIIESLKKKNEILVTKMTEKIMIKYTVS